MKKKFKKILTLIVVFFIMGNSVFAQDTEEPQSYDREIAELEQLKADLLPIINEQPISVCEQTLIPVYDIEARQFLLFLQQHFRNKSSTKSLTNTAIARYRKYKNNREV